MVEYLYFVRFDNNGSSPFSYDEEVFDNFEEAKDFARSAMSRSPEIHQTEVIRNDFGECIDSSELGMVWSWKEEMSDILDNDEATFSKADTFDADDFDSEFEYSDDDIVFETDCVGTNRKPLPADMTIEALVEAMEENEDIVECKECYELAAKQDCTYEEGRGYVCNNCLESITTDENHVVLGDELEEELSLEEAYHFPYLAALPDAKEQLMDALQNDIHIRHYFNNGRLVGVQANYESGWSVTVTDFIVTANNEIEICYSDRGQAGFEELKEFMDGLNPRCSGHSVVSRLYDEATRLNRANNPRNPRAVAARNRNITTYFRNNPAVANEFQEHITKIRFEIPIIENENDLYGMQASGKDLSDKAINKLIKIYTGFFEGSFEPYAKAALQAGMIIDRLPDVENDTDYGIASSWGPVGKITFDAPVNTLTQLHGAINTAKGLPETDTAITEESSRTIDCVRLATTLIRYFNNVKFFETVSAAAEVAATTEALKESKSMLEEVEEPEDYRARLVMCPECGDNAFDLETGICINCGFN